MPEIAETTRPRAKKRRLVPPHATPPTPPDDDVARVYHALVEQFGGAHEVDEDDTARVLHTTTKALQASRYGDSKAYEGLKPRKRGARVKYQLLNIARILAGQQ